MPYIGNPGDSPDLDENGYLQLNFEMVDGKKQKAPGTKQ